MLQIRYGHYHEQVGHGCLATRQMWKRDWLLSLYFTVARQQGTHLTSVFLKKMFKI